MDIRRLRASPPYAVFVVLLVVALGFAAQRHITVTAFDEVEADRVAHDAQRIRIALDYEVRLLSDYGATNSMWDSSYTDVRTADRAAFETDFPPQSLRSMYGIDGVVATAPDGAPRLGGLAGPQTGYAPLPADLAEPSALRRLFDIDAEAGKARCGVVRTSAVPFLYCGFASYPTDGSGEAAGGLIYLKALDQARLSALGGQIGLPVKLSTRARPSDGGSLTLGGLLGEVKVTTRVAGDDRIDLSVEIPGTDGTPIVMEAVRDRPIHATATAALRDVFLLTALAGALLAGAMTVMVRRGIRRQVEPLLRTAEAAIASGDRRLRVGSGAGGEIGALGRAIDTMLEAVAARDEELERVDTAREEHLRATYAERQLSEQQARQRAQEMIADNVATVMGELRTVIGKAEDLRRTADTIDERVSMTDAITDRVVGQARWANETVAHLEASLRKVDGIARIIAQVASQTNLLALNATIEAVHAGEAGKGFSVVANEVKELATSTTRSTGEITAIVRSLEQNATAMADALTAMTGGVDSLGQAAAQVGTLTREQHASVEGVRRYLEQAMRRISAMADLTNQLERRNAPRAPISGATRIHLDGKVHPAHLIDVSSTGAHCSTGPDVPLAAGDRVQVDIPLPGGGPVRADAEVVHYRRHDDAAELGLRFTGLPPALATRIHHYVTASARDAGGPGA
ncbi:hypothetical protein GCM10010466_30960 [Planomonospora alba]|uniref:PCS -12 protein n=1 Tax=Planomonospora alba TaxID=161354 RepID=R4ZCX0_9ACTN|nr:PCS -12 [Planomonospora alba]